MTTFTQNRYAEVFKAKGRNFITPNVEYYLENKEKGISIELSTGDGFMGDPMWGITPYKNGRIHDELAECRHSKKEALEYIECLKNIL